MMKQIKKYGIYLILPLLLILFTASLCRDDEIGHFETAQLINQSDETIYLGCQPYDNEHKPIDNQYIFSYFRLDYQNFKIIKSKESNSEIFVQEGKRFYIIIFKESTFAKYSVQELIETNYCDKYYDYSYDDLKAMNFTITYTGE